VKDALSPPDTLHLAAAEGWLELGNWSEATAELGRITPVNLAHPDVLVIRYEIYAMAAQWEMAATVADEVCRLAPDDAIGWIYRSFALHELKQTEAAWVALLPAAEKFPEEPEIPYNLACYAAQTGRLKEARVWLAQAFEVGEKEELRTEALEDPDLMPLRTEIGKL
jgi:Flp pilus assembly protein TadD